MNEKIELAREAAPPPLPEKIKASVSQNLHPQHLTIPLFDRLLRREYRTETAVKCKKRLERNCSKLFTFLDYDGVPWNNNNAEHAIKAFVMLRRGLGGVSTEKGIKDYLTLLSVSETCKLKGVRFLDFLRSGEVDIDAFAANSHRR